MRHVIVSLLSIVLLASCRPYAPGDQDALALPPVTMSVADDSALPPIEPSSFSVDFVPERVIETDAPAAVGSIRPGPGQFSVAIDLPHTTSPAEYQTVRDGQLLIDQPGWLVKTDRGSGWSFKFRRSDGQKLPIPPMELLPAAYLADMAAALAGRDPAVTTFIVDGEVAVYRGKPYLLVRQAFIRETGDVGSAPATGEAPTTPQELRR